MSQDSFFVTRVGNDLYYKGKKFFSIGVNCYYLQNLAGRGDTSIVNEIFKLAKTIGINTIRTWGFYDHSDSSISSVIQYAPGKFNERGLRALDYVIHKAKQYAIKLVIPLVNNWDDYGGMNKYVEWYIERFKPFEKILTETENQNNVISTDGRSYRKMVSQSMGHDDFYTNALIKSWYVDYILKILFRQNVYTNVRYCDDPTVMAWELANEPRSSDTSGEIVYQWIKEMVDFIKLVDKNHLVGTGEEGFDIDKNFYDGLSSFPNWMFDGSAGVSFKKNCSIANIDIASIHYYQESWGFSNQNKPISGEDFRRWLDAHLRITSIYTKPLLIGEVGAKSLKYFYYNSFLNKVLNSNCAGVLIWQLSTSNIPFNDEYSFTCGSKEDICKLIQQYIMLMNNKIDGIFPSPLKNEIIQNYPNPFNEVSLVTYKVEREQFILLELYDILGKRVAVLAENIHSPGDYSIVLDGRSLASGIYIVVMRYSDGFNGIKVLKIK